MRTLFVGSMKLRGQKALQLRYFDAPSISRVVFHFHETQMMHFRKCLMISEYFLSFMRMKDNSFTRIPSISQLAVYSHETHSTRVIWRNDKCPPASPYLKEGKNERYYFPVGGIKDRARNMGHIHSSIDKTECTRSMNRRISLICFTRVSSLLFPAFG